MRFDLGIEDKPLAVALRQQKLCVKTAEPIILYGYRLVSKNTQRLFAIKVYARNSTEFAQTK